MSAIEHHDHPTPLTERVKITLLIGLGCYFVYIIVSGNLTNYVNARFGWLSYVAAALFLLLGIASAYQQDWMRNHAHDHSDHDHGTISWGVLAIIALPLVLGTLIPSQPLGAAAVGGEINTIAGDTASTFNIAPEDRNILDWVRAFNSTDNAADFNGLPVDVVGFVYRGENFANDQYLVARFTISCCVADSTAIGVPIWWDQPLEVDTWVRVQGHLQAGEFNGAQWPIIQPDNLEVVERPEHPYLYP